MPSRADARENRKKIIEATIEALQDNPQSSIASIARIAGVGRMTLIGHFRTRSELLDATLHSLVEKQESIVSSLESTHAAVSTDQDERSIFIHLLEHSWENIASAAILFDACSMELDAEHISLLRSRFNKGLIELIQQGYEDKYFNTSLELDWILGVIEAVCTHATRVVKEGLMQEKEAAQCIITTVLSGLSLKDSR